MALIDVHGLGDVQTALDNHETRLLALQNGGSMPLSVQTYGAKGDGVTDDTAAIQASLTAALGATSHVFVPGTTASYLISSPLVIGSNVWLELAQDATITLAPGSNCPMLKNAANTPQRSVTDAAITALATTLTSATAAFTSADVGRTVIVAGAGPAGGAAQLVAKITAFTNSTTVTVSIAATTTVSGAAASIYTRDTNVTVTGGTWARGANAGTTTNLHTMLLRRIDGLFIHDLTVSSSAGKYMIAPGDVTNVYIQNVNCQGTSASGNSGVQINGPASFVTVRHVYGTTSDDLVALTARDFATYEDTLGDITDVEVSDILSTSCLCAIKMISGTGINLKRITCDRITGAVTSSGVKIQDDLAGASNISEIAVRNVDVQVPSANAVVVLQSQNIRDVVLDGIRLDGTGLADARIVGIEQSYLGTTAVESLTIRDARLLGTPTLGYIVYVNGASTVNELLVDNSCSPEANSGTVTGVNVASATGYVKTIRYVNFAMPGVGNLVNVATTGGKLDRCLIANGYLVATGVLLATASGTNACALHVTNVNKSGGSFDVTAATPMTIELTNVTSTAGTAVVRVQGVNATPVRILGAGCNLSATAGVTRDGSQAVSVKHRDIKADLGILTPSSGDFCINTAAATGVRPGAGDVNYDGTAWRLNSIAAVKSNTATLVAGTVTVADTAITANSVIRVFRRSIGGTVGALYVSALTASTSFAITSTNASDTSVVYYEIVSY